MDGNYLNIKVDLDGHVVRKRRALSKLADQLGSYTDAIEHVIADVLLTEYGITREQLGGMLSEMADAAMYHHGMTFVYELIPTACEYSNHTLDRDRLQPYRVMALVNHEWQLLGRYRSDKRAIYNMLKECYKYDHMRVSTHWSVNGQWRDYMLMAEVKRDNNGKLWYATDVFGVCDTDSFTSWHKASV
jgi:hypothetical protein